MGPRLVASQIPGIEIDYVDTVEDLRSYRVSFEKIKHVLGFSPRHRIEDGVLEVKGLLERGEVDPDDVRTSNLAYLKANGFRGNAADAAPLGAVRTDAASVAS